MIRSPFFLKACAFVLALGVHGLIIVSFQNQTVVQIESSAGVQTAALGNSFTDLVTGTLSADTPQKTIKQEVANSPQSIEPTVASKLRQVPQTAEIQKHAALNTKQVVRETIPTLSKQTLRDIASQRIQATADLNASTVKRSKRPKKRSAQMEQRIAKVQASDPSKKGNAKLSAKAGNAKGSKKSKSAKQGNGTRAKKRAGNAAASTYPGKVMAKISSVGRPNVSERGTAVIRFTIGTNGNLRSAGVISSSGSRRLDKAAMSILYRAIPFPKPPAGARRTFSINIAGR